MVKDGYVLETQGLVVGYPGNPLLGPLNLRLRLGDVLIVFGPNGSGKTTLLKTLTGLRKPLQGRIICCGGEPSRTASFIYLVPETTTLPVSITAEDYVKTIALLYKADSESVEEALAIVDIPRKVLIAKLSQGQRRRLQLSTAIVVKKKVRFIAIDDPTVGLDDEGLPLLADIVKNIKNYSAVIITSRENRLIELFHKEIPNTSVLHTDELRYRATKQTITRSTA
ncbi:MAG: ATP-binding cassette domain-containing protein [Ignisphaera sp.]